MTELRTFLRELRSALAHLDEPLWLEKHPLTQQLEMIAQAPEGTRGLILRRILRRAIEALDPGMDVPTDTPEARRYQVLYRYAILKQSMQTIALELDIGDRQAYRDLALAIQSLACMLTEKTSPPPENGQVNPLYAEIERLSVADSQELDLLTLVKQILASLQPLADERRVKLLLNIESANIQVAVQRVILRQALLNLLSYLIRVQEGQVITITLRSNLIEALLTISWPKNVPDPLAMSEKFFSAMGYTWSIVTTHGMAQLELRIPLTSKRTILVIDDNEGHIALYRGYLRGRPYQIIGVRNGSEGLTLIKHLRPDLVILDVMMPDQDGWEILEMLRTDEAYQGIRVIVCSVIDDPDLARSLHADAFLPKPVDRVLLLQTLERLLSCPHS